MQSFSFLAYSVLDPEISKGPRDSAALTMRRRFLKMHSLRFFLAPILNTTLTMPSVNSIHPIYVGGVNRVMRQGIPCKFITSIFKSPTFIPSIYHKSIFDLLYLPAALSLITYCVSMDETITGANVQC